MSSSATSALGNLRAYLDPSQVGFLIFYVTNRCNFRCNFCFYSAEIEKGLKPDELTVAEIERMARSIGPLLQLSLTGGEAFLRRELLEITSLLLDHTGARYVTIPTNASLTERMVRFLEEILPRYPKTFFRLTFSIEGIGEEHDQLRSMPGSYAKIQESYAAISPMRERFPNLVLDCNSVFTAKSETTLLATLKHLAKTFRFDNMSVTYARGTVRDETLKKVSKERYREINAFLESLERRKETRLLYPLWRGARDVSRDMLMRTVFDNEFIVPCVAGRKLIVISETGEVYPCEILGRSMGNLREFDFDLKRLTETAKSRDLVKWIKDTNCKCSFECALAANVVWNPSTYPKLAVSALRNIGK
jgi:radical SAM protein with 4Fe4S-binding SPASM domain